MFGVVTFKYINFPINFWNLIILVNKLSELSILSLTTLEQNLEEFLQVYNREDQTHEVTQDSTFYV